MQTPDPVDQQPSQSADVEGAKSSPETQPAKPAEIGGRKGLDPTRYGDWEKDGRCIDF
jgi:shikimate dehydrogenase